MKFDQLTKKTKLIALLVLVAVIGISWYSIALRSDNRISKELKEMPTGTVQLINDLGRTINLSVKVADTVANRNAGFKGVGANVVHDSILYYIYPRMVSDRHNIQGLRVPIDVAYFDAEGKLVGISKVTVGKDSPATFGPPAGVQYRYILMAREGYFSRNIVTVNGGARLNIESFTRR